MRFDPKLSGGKDPLKEIEVEARDAVIKDSQGNVVFEQKSVVVPKAWSQQATNIVAEKYFRYKEGHKESSALDMVSRVAKTIADWGLADGYFDTAEEDADTFYYELAYILIHQMAAFNSPVWFNVGVEDEPQIAACFIQSVEDSLESIMDLAKNESMLFKHGSGTGSNLSNLRSSKEKLRGGGYSSGPVSFMKGFDAFAGVVKSGGKTRRAAKMVILDVDHPDIEEFVQCKSREEGKARALVKAGYDSNFNVSGGAYDSISYQNANHSVRVTDGFMEAVESGDKWLLKSRTTDKTWEVDARELFHKMAQAAWECGDPGMQFHGIINKMHTSKASGEIRGSNPCIRRGERILTDQGWRRIEELAGEFTLLSDTVGYVEGKVWKSGVKPIMRLWISDGKTLDVTPDHRILTNKGWIEAKNSEGLYVATGDHDRTPTILDTWIVRVEDLGIEDEVYDFSCPTTQAGIVSGVVVHNCSEYVHLDDSACNLASLNLKKFLKGDKIDIATYKHVIRVMITAMDILIDRASYPTEKIAKNARRFRQLGLGYANLGALLMSLGLPYDSDEGRDLAASLTSLMTAQAYKVSAELAGELGGYEGLVDRNNACYNLDHHIKVMREHYDSVEYGGLLDKSVSIWEESYTLWGEVAYSHTFRNAQATVLAPTGTIAFLMDCDTTGIEPELALVKYKKLVGGGTIQIVNQSVREALENLGYCDQTLDTLLRYLENHGTFEGGPLLSEYLPVFDCAFKALNGSRSIHYTGHIHMMAAVQPFLSGAISKTVNMPTEATIEDIQDAYMQAWKMGLKAIAIYRDGCKDSQPLSTGSDKVETRPDRKTPTRNRLPNERNSKTIKFAIGGHEGYATVGLYEDGSPGELFIKMAKEGSIVSGFADAFATMVSMALQHGAPLETIYDKLIGTRFEPDGFTGNPEFPRVSSILDYLGRWLKVHWGSELGDSVEIESDTSVEARMEPKSSQPDLSYRTCPECGSLMEPSGSCYRCPNCGTTSGCS